MNNFLNRIGCSLFKQHSYYIIAITKDENCHIEECYNCKKLRKLSKEWVVVK